MGRSVVLDGTSEPRVTHLTHTPEAYQGLMRYS